MPILDYTNPAFDCCVDLFHRLTPQEQAALLEKLADEMKNGDSTPKKASTKDAFGAGNRTKAPRRSFGIFTKAEP